MKGVGTLVQCRDCRSSALGLSAVAWALITLCTGRGLAGSPRLTLFSLCPELPWIHDLDLSSLHIFLLSGSWPQSVLTQTLKSLQLWDRGSTHSAPETALILGGYSQLCGDQQGPRAAQHPQCITPVVLALGVPHYSPFHVLPHDLPGLLHLQLEDSLRCLSAFFPGAPHSQGSHT